MSRPRNAWVLPVSVLVALLLGLVPLPAMLQPKSVVGQTPGSPQQGPRSSSAAFTAMARRALSALNRVRLVFQRIPSVASETRR